MRDRTVVLLALLFLILTVGAGVNRSLAAGNKMLGRQMAPSAMQIYQQQAPVVLNEVKAIAEYGRDKGLEFSRLYPVLTREIQHMQVEIQQKVSALVKACRYKWADLFTRNQAMAVSEKNRMLR